jgi:Protein of unknown function (DUF2384)
MAGTQVLHPTLFNASTGRLDAERIAEEMAVPVKVIADALGLKAPGVRKNPDATRLQTDLRRIYTIWTTLVELYSGDKTHARIFLNTPNRYLNRKAPIEFIELGSLEPVEALLDAMMERQPT